MRLDYPSDTFVAADVVVLGEARLWADAEGRILYV